MENFKSLLLGFKNRQLRLSLRATHRKAINDIIFATFGREKPLWPKIRQDKNIGLGLEKKLEKKSSYIFCVGPSEN